MNEQAAAHSGRAAAVPDGGEDRVTAVVLAGGDAGDVLARAVGAAAKALVPLKGRTLGSYVLDALAGASRVRRIVWVGAADAAVRRRADVLVPGGARLVDSLALGLGAAAAGAAPSERLLIVTADVPWLTASAVDGFVSEAGSDHDLVYPVVPRAAFERAFPGMPRTWVRLADGEVTGGNLLSARPEAMIAALPLVDAVTRSRKEPWRLAALTGPGVLLRFLTGTARLAGLERRVGERLGVRVRALPTDDATLACDVDRPEHLPATLGIEHGAAPERPTA